MLLLNSRCEKDIHKNISHWIIVGSMVFDYDVFLHLRVRRHPATTGGWERGAFKISSVIRHNGLDASVVIRFHRKDCMIYCPSTKETSVTFCTPGSRVTKVSGPSQFLAQVRFVNFVHSDTRPITFLDP